MEPRINLCLYDNPKVLHSTNGRARITRRSGNSLPAGRRSRSGDEYTQWTWSALCRTWSIFGMLFCLRPVYSQVQ